MAKRGRKLTEIDKKAFEKLCQLQCTLPEFCDFFDVTHKTLETWCKRTYNLNFSQIFAIKKGKGKISLRRMGWQLAEKNAGAWIFLAKNHLGMKDNPDETPDNNAAKAIADAISYLRGETEKK